MRNTLREQLAEEIYLSFVEDDGVYPHPLQDMWNNLGGVNIQIGSDIDEFLRHAIDYTLQQLENMDYNLTEKELIQDCLAGPCTPQYTLTVSRAQKEGYPGDVSLQLSGTNIPATTPLWMEYLKKPKLHLLNCILTDTELCSTDAGVATVVGSFQDDDEDVKLITSTAYFKRGDVTMPIELVYPHVRMPLNEIHSAVMANARKVRKVFAKEYPEVPLNSFSSTFTEGDLTDG